jgi:hypothetical protein
MKSRKEFARSDIKFYLRRVHILLLPISCVRIKELTKSLKQKKLSTGVQQTGMKTIIKPKDVLRGESKMLK